MSVRLLTTPTELQMYDRWVKTHPQGNLWQSLERKRYVEAVGKESRIYVAEESGRIAASALVVVDRTSFGLSMWEIPRGPLMKAEVRNEETEVELLEAIIADAKRDRCMALYLSPPATLLTSHFCLLPSSRLVHASVTRIIDLTQGEQDILAQMKPKGRYNIRVAEKHGVRVEESDNIDAFYTLVQETARRDGFTPQPKEKYQAFLEQLPDSFLLTASPQFPIPCLSGRQANSQFPIIAALLGVIWHGTGIYYYGASSYGHRTLMAPYALQWAAMQRCKAAGCTKYDLLGIAPPDAPSTHPWNGISRFKEHFGGTLVTYPPEQQLVLRPFMKCCIELKRKIIK